MSNNNKTHDIYRPIAPGEEVILHCGPLHDVTTLIVEILYPLSVSGTIVKKQQHGLAAKAVTKSCSLFMLGLS